MTNYSNTPYASYVSGDEADPREFDSCGRAVFKVLTGAHHSHELTVETNKFNCGGCSEERRCSCGSVWVSQVNGCWDHKREEGGDQSLAIIRLAPIPD